MAVVTKMVPTTKRLDSPAEPSHLPEGIGLVLFAVTVLVTLSLVSFQPADRSWSVVGTTGATGNWIGPVGANISDVLFQTFGLVAFLVPALLAILSWKVFWSRWTWPTIPQTCGLLGLFFSLAGLFSLFPEIPLFRSRILPGGFLGQVLERFLEGAFNKIGTSLFLAVVVLLALMLLTRVSLRQVLLEYLHLDAVGRAWAGLRTNVRNWFRRSPKSEPLLAEPSDNRLASLSNVTALPTAVPTGKLVEPPAGRKKKSWFGSSSKAAPVSEDEEKVQSEQKVLDALYSDYKSPSGTLRGEEGVGQVSSLPRLSEPPALGELNLASGDTIDLLESLKEFPEIPSNEPALLNAPGPSGSGSIPGEAPISNTRKFAREAIRKAQERAKGIASHELPPPEPVAPKPEVMPPIVKKLEPPVEKPDPEIEKMVQGASIIRHKSTDTGEWRTGQQQRVVAAVPRAAMKPVGGIPPLPRSPEPVAKSATLSYFLPPLEMLQEAPEPEEQAETELRQRAKVLAEKCREFNVTGEIHHINPGPVVTTFEFKPDPGVKYSRVANLVDDLCLALKAESIRIDRLPGKSTVGIEVPNSKREVIFLREIVESDKYQTSGSCLTIALGKTIEGNTYVSDLMKMPHLLIAGSTGSGKSVMVNTLIVSILLKASPADVKMIMVDPKRLELGLYEGIPHLLTPIVTDPKRASNALKWAVTEMENRYKQLAGFGVRNIDQFNREICGSNDVSRFGIQEPPPKLPYIVIVIDELADLMMVASSDVETSITRLAQMARAVGIHLVVATQRPSVDVITGLIKANFPARISFRVSSKVDSRTILDTNGAEGLLGQGDMLFLPPGTSRLVRVHGSYVGEAEINRIVDHIKSQGQPQYDESIQMSDAEAEAAEAGMGERDELFDEAMKIVVQMGKASTSVLQRRLRIGYGRAAAILDMMEQEGYIGPPDGSKPRVVKQLAYDYVEMLEGKALNGDDD